MNVAIAFTVAAAVMAGYTAMTLPAKEAREAALASEVAAVNFMNYRRAAMDFFNANSGHDGPITDAQLASHWPSGFVRDTRRWPWQSAVIDGVLYTYSTSASCGEAQSCDSVAREIYYLSGRAANVGLASGSRLKDRDGVTAIELPASIPTGAVVAYGSF